MPTKPTKRVAAPKPVVNFYMAEDLRQEVNGKVTAIGLYPDHVAILQIPEDIPDPTDAAPIFIKSMGFLFNVSGITKPTTVSVDIESGGKRKPFLEAQEFAALEPGKSLNLLGVMAPCQVSSFGKKKLYVIVGDSVQALTIEFRRVSIPPIGFMPAPQVAAPKVAKRVIARPTKPTKPNKPTKATKSAK